MTLVQRHVVAMTLFLSCAAALNAAGPATVENVSVAPSGSDLRVEVTLSSPVKVSVETAIHPDRILLDFPETLCQHKIQEIEVNRNGVKRVRTAQHSVSPAITRVVLELDAPHAYTLQSAGNQVTLLVTGETSVRAASHGAPAAAVSGSVFGIFRRKQPAPAPITADSAAPVSLPAPPPSRSEERRVGK